MGRGIAQLMAQSGIQTVLYDTNSDALEGARQFLQATLETLSAKGKISAQAATEIMKRVRYAQEIHALRACDLVIEAIVEKLEVKQALFKQLESFVQPNTILASNTSSLSITALASACARPEQVAGLHFFNPVPLMKVVEIVRAIRTDPGVIEVLKRLIKVTGHQAVECADFPGFIVNHAGRGYNTEGMKILSESVVGAPHDPASFEKLDLILREQVQFFAVKEGLRESLGGFRLGVCELLDLTALDVSHPVMESIYHQFYEEARFRPSVITAQRLAAGLVGRKAGAGFYNYEAGQKKSTLSATPPTCVPADGSLPHSVWIAPCSGRASTRDEVQSLVTALGVQCESGTEPSPSALIIVLPLGHDCTAETSKHGLDAHRTVALDTLFEFGKGKTRRRVVMRNPASSPLYVQQALALFSQDGAAVSLIEDSAGFVAQRVVALIVSIACEIAQQGIASAADIDTAVRLGLGYPLGPLSMGDQLGADQILTVLNNMHQLTGDPRYRPSAWLRRRAQLNQSLLV